MRKAILLTTVASGLTLLSAAPAYAQSSDADEQASSTRGFEDIIVTARRQEETLQTVPVAVSVIDQHSSNPRAHSVRKTSRHRFPA